MTPENSSSQSFFKLHKYAIAIGVITAVFFLLSVWHLGDKRFPLSDWSPTSNPEAVYLDLGAPTRVDKVFVLVQDDSKVDLDIFWGSPGNWNFLRNLQEQGVHRKWREESLGQETRYVRLLFRGGTGRIGEVALYASGNKLPIQSIVDEVEGQSADTLIDEQAFIDNPARHESGTYFDEIYFVRAAEDTLRVAEPSERTHPPLSKLIIAGSIAFIGYNPFGWRFAGVIFAAAAIPLVYLFAKRMFDSKRAGLFAALLLALDFMHFTMGRIATGETFILFFIIAMFYFFYRYYENTERGAPYLFLSLVFFGLGFATKWVTMYGFVALLILLVLAKWRKPIRRNEVFAFVGGGAAAVSIYMLSYIPYFMVGHGLGDFLDFQFFMFDFHSGLEATHPYQSAWWTWPLDLKPLWMYVGYFDQARSYISSMGNPVLWWASVPLMLLTAWYAITRRNKIAAFLAIPFFAQWLIFIPISRPLFIYHFFPNVLFMVLAAAFWMERLWNWKRLRPPESSGSEGSGIWSGSVKPWLQRNLLTGKSAVASYIALNAVFFIFFFPVISGYTVGTGYWDSLQWLVGWVS